MIKFGVGAAFQRRWDHTRLPGGVVAVGDCVQGVNPVGAAQGEGWMGEGVGEGLGVGRRCRAPANPGRGAPHVQRGMRHAAAPRL